MLENKPRNSLLAIGFSLLTLHSEHRKLTPFDVKAEDGVQ